MMRLLSRYFTGYSAVILFLTGTLCAIFSAAVAGEVTINYRLKWLVNASVAGDIYAIEYDFFDKVGLNVTVKPGGPERDAIRELELGTAQFGVASADQVIRAVEKGASVVVVAQLFHTNPLQWIYRADGLEVSSIGDLRGKHVGVTYGGNDETIMKALLAKSGIKESEVSITSVRYDYTPFLRKQVDIWPVYQNTQGVYLGNKLAEAGERTGFLNPSDFGVRFVANSVVTSEKMLQEHPEVVEKFVTALLAAWEAALRPENLGKSIEAIAKHDKDSSAETIQQQVEATRIMVKPTDEYPIGKIDTKAWIETEKIMLDQYLIKSPVNIEQRLKPLP